MLYKSRWPRTYSQKDKMFRPNTVVCFCLGLVLVTSPVSGQSRRQAAADDCSIAGPGLSPLPTNVPDHCRLFLSCPRFPATGWIMQCPEGACFSPVSRSCVAVTNGTDPCFGKCSGSIISPDSGRNNGNRNNNRFNGNNNRNNNRFNGNNNRNNNRNPRFPVVNSNDRQNRNRNRPTARPTRPSRPTRPTNPNTGRNTLNQGRNTNTNFNGRRNTNTPRRPVRNQAQLTVRVPVRNVRELAGDQTRCDQIERTLNNDFESLVSQIGGVPNPDIPRLNLDCGTQQNRPIRPQQNRPRPSRPTRPQQNRPRPTRPQQNRPQQNRPRPTRPNQNNQNVPIWQRG